MRLDARDWRSAVALEIDRLPQAAADLDDIWMNIALDNVVAADRVVRRVYDAEDQLSEFPFIGAVRPDLSPDLRYWPVGDYLIFYRIDAATLTVVRILHGARDLPSLFDN